MNYINSGWNNNNPPSVSVTASRRAQSVEKVEPLLARWNVSTITHRTAIDNLFMFIHIIHKQNFYTLCGLLLWRFSFALVAKLYIYTDYTCNVSVSQSRKETLNHTPYSTGCCSNENRI